MGNSVGRWDGDALVIDTVGVRTDAFTSVDRFGTPQSDAMHVIERYVLIDGAAAKAAQDKYETGGGHGRRRRAVFRASTPDTSLKGLQLDVTMDDPKVFTAPR